ncbi:hypothetical protein FRC03_003007 [Tulasnella sp. 419]|nr:hypothetical protein FRC03_003007 [Tulasnella sp. 419]
MFKLSATLQSHSSDVRSVVSPSPTLVLSSSRDSSAIVWTRPDESATFSPTTVYHPSSRFVNAVAYLQPTPEAPQGYLVTGSQDGIINVYTLGTEQQEPSYTLLGHAHNVCALSTTASGTIVSGSWDQTSIVWASFQKRYDLRGHAQSVLAVLAISEDEYLTASADKSIKLWKLHKCVQTFTGHTDVVRDLALIPDVGFVSCSNDSEIRVWTMGGDTIHILSGHTSFVYSVDLLPNGDIVSGGEDRTVRVWADGECKQTIVHPAISVWTVCAMPNGDIVSGCSDSVVRVFSSVKDRWLSEGELKEYDDLVAGQALPAQQVGDVNKSKLPGLEALNNPGKKEGQTIMVLNPQGVVEAHSWIGGAWQKVGDVVDAVGQNRKQLFNGQEYDYVFDVDISDDPNAPKLKLPYNANENPYSAAQRFLAQNDLPPSYLDDVVKFIEKNTSGVSIGTGSGFADPFTGASRYQPAAAQAGGGAGVYQDPFTGASRYQAPAAPTTSSNNSANYADPFTGSSSYRTSSSTHPAAPAPAPAPATATATKLKVLPVKTTLPFRQANIGAMQAKMKELNETLQHSGVSFVSMSDARSLDRAFLYVQSVDPATGASRGNAPEPRWGDIDVVLQMVGSPQWPESHRFPGIDLLRLLFAFCPKPAGAPENFRTVALDSLLSACNWQLQADHSAPVSKSRETNLLLVLRTLANCFQIGGASGTEAFGGGQWTEKLFTELGKCNYEKLSKPQHAALATLLLNFSAVALIDNEIDASSRQKQYELTLMVLQKEEADSETVLRSLAALGNSIYKAGTKPSDARLTPILEHISSKFREERLDNIISDIRALSS